MESTEQPLEPDYSKDSLTRPSRFRTLKASVGRDYSARSKAKQNLLPFGVKFLDDALDGIAESDVVLLTGWPGGGKTELAVHIAKTNALQGRRVAFFALEAEEDEVLYRIKYKMCADRYFDKPTFPPKIPQIHYRLWRNGLIHFGDEIEMPVDQEIEEKYPTLSVLYRDREFTIQDFASELAIIAKDTDLIVVDHLHYFDIPADERNENRAFSDIVKQIRDLALIFKKPIVLVAHLRKKDKNDESLLPDMEDVHGTSNQVKIATKMIVLARDRETPAISTKVFNTYCSAPKYRLDGSATFYAAQLGFNIETNAYEDAYTVGRLMNRRTKFEPLVQTAIMPWWAKHAKRE